MTEPVLAVSGLRKTYRVATGPDVQALKGVSFSIDEGETVGLVGGSGSGKSTTARCVLQLERPDTGSVLFSGTDLCTLRGRRLRHQRRGMQLVFQDPLSSLDPRWTAAQTVEEPLRATGMVPAKRAERVTEALSIVGLGGAAHKHPHELSGGQAQRVAIARSVAGYPRLLICDEATSALDVSIQAQILNLLRDLQRAFGLALLFISHDLGVVRAVCHRVLVMQDGLIIEEGETSAVMSSPEHEYTERLVAAVSGEW
jgi:peptide/nickel transport system ATP-binding protein